MTEQSTEGEKETDLNVTPQLGRRCEEKADIQQLKDVLQRQHGDKKMDNPYILELQPRGVLSLKDTYQII